jgi:ribose-phosphate pyrophosphokinase
LSEPAIDRLNSNQNLETLVVTNSIPQIDNVERCNKITVLDIAPLLGEAIRRIHHKESLSELFNSNEDS